MHLLSINKMLDVLKVHKPLNIPIIQLSLQLLLPSL
jgi:hypothetical protein